MMAKFMKGVFSLRPPEPKYFVAWDVRQVLDFLKTWSLAESMSLKQLTFKPNGVLFKVPGLTKCTGLNLFALLF